MNEPRKYIGCYFQEVSAIMGSYILEKIGSFSIFVLAAINDEYNLQDIQKSSGFSKYVVDQAVQTLCSEGLLFIKKNRYGVSSVGKKYIKIYNTIKKFNEQSSRFAVNCYTGQMEKIEYEWLYDEKTDLHNKIDILPQNIDNVMLKSPDYENVKEYMRKEDIVSELQDDDYDYVYFRLQPKGNRFIVPYYVIPQVYSYDESDDTNKAKVVLRVPIARVTVRMYCEEDMDYESELDKLLAIADKDISLLSEKGKGIVEREKRLKNKNSNAAFKFYDAFGKSSLLFDVNDNNTNDSKSKWALIELPRNLEKKEKKIIKDGIIKVYDFKYTYIDREILFNRLIQAGVYYE